MSDEMQSPEMQSFFKLHSDLPREGPGVPADVAWAAEVAGLPRNARIADVGCGPGADIAPLLEAAPEGHVTALDLVAHFVDAARAQFREDERVTVLKADMATIMNPHDMIWCAGALYFLGVTEGLRTWRKALAPGGVVAFSQACWFTDAPSARAKAYWESEYPQMTDEAGVMAQVAAAGYEVLGSRRLSDAAWEAYFQPIEARVDTLRAGADEALSAVLDEALEEIAVWRAHRTEYGYLQIVARPA